jgi:hypothetical protein
MAFAEDLLERLRDRNLSWRQINPFKNLPGEGFWELLRPIRESARRNRKYCAFKDVFV